MFAGVDRMACQAFSIKLTSHIHSNVNLPGSYIQQSPSNPKIQQKIITEYTPQLSLHCSGLESLATLSLLLLYLPFSPDHFLLHSLTTPFIVHLLLSPLPLLRFMG